MKLLWDGRCEKTMPIDKNMIKKSDLSLFYERIPNMSNSEALNELYEACKDISLEEADRIVVETKDEDEKTFLEW